MKNLIFILIVMIPVAIASPQVYFNQTIEGGEYSNSVFINSTIRNATISFSQIIGNSFVYESRVMNSSIMDAYLYSNYLDGNRIEFSEFEGGEIWSSNTFNSYIGWGTFARDGNYTNVTFDHADAQSPSVDSATIISSEIRGGNLVNVYTSDSRLYYIGIENAYITSSNLSSFHITNGFVDNSILQAGEVTHFYMSNSWLNFIKLEDGETHNTTWWNVVPCSVWDNDTQTFYPQCEPNGPFAVVNPR